MISIAKLQEDLYDILSSVTAAPVILQDEEGDAPADSYIAYNLKNWKQIGVGTTGEYRDLNTTDYTVTSLWEVKLNILAVGRDANQLAVEVSQRLNRSSTRYMFDDAGLTFQYQTEIKYAPKIMTTGWEPRYYFDVCINLLMEDVDSVNYWEFLEITTEVKNELGQVSLSETDIIDIIP